MSVVTFESDNTEEITQTVKTVPAWNLRQISVDTPSGADSTIYLRIATGKKIVTTPSLGGPTTIYKWDTEKGYTLRGAEVDEMMSDNPTIALAWGQFAQAIELYSRNAGYLPNEAIAVKD